MGRSRLARISPPKGIRKEMTGAARTYKNKKKDQKNESQSPLRFMSLWQFSISWGQTVHQQPYRPSGFNIIVTLPNLDRHAFRYLTSLVSLNHNSLKENVTGRTGQATTSPLRATITDAFRETQQLQTSGKKRLRINPRARAGGPYQKWDRQRHKEEDHRCSKNL